MNKLTKGLLSSVSPRGKGQEETARTKKAPGAGHSTAMSEEQRMRARSALDTLTMAENHRRDKTLMRDVQRLASEHVDNINRALSGSVKRSK